MVEEELVDLIAESIYRNLRDGKLVTVKPVEYTELSETAKSTLLNIAHNVIAVVDDYYDLESEIDDDEDDEDLDFDDSAVYGVKEW